MRYPKDYRNRSAALVPPAVLDVGRKLLGYLENQRRLGGVQTLRAQKELPDGTIVRAMIVNGVPMVEYIPPGGGEPVLLPCKYFLETGQIDLVNKELTFGTTAVADDRFGGLQGPATHDGKVFFSGNRDDPTLGVPVKSTALRAARPLKREGLSDFVFADKAQTQERMPPSLWTGLMRLYVQSLYGDPDAQYGYVSIKNMRASKIGTVSHDIQSYVDLLAVPALGAGGVREIKYLNPGFTYGLSEGPYQETYQIPIPGTHGISQANDFAFYLVEVTISNCLFYKIVFDSCGQRLLRLRAGLDDQGGTLPEITARKRRLLAYAFTRSIINANHGGFAGNTWIDEPTHVPMGRYGWKFNSTGSEISIVTYEQDPAPYSGPSYATDPDFPQSGGPRQKVKPSLRKVVIAYTGTTPASTHSVVEAGGWIGMNDATRANRFPFCWISETARAYNGVIRGDRLSGVYDPGAYEGASAFENNTYDVPVYCFYKNDDTLEVIRWLYEPVSLLPKTTDAEVAAANAEVDSFVGEFKRRDHDQQTFNSGFYCGQYTTVGESTCDNSGFYGPLEYGCNSRVYFGDGPGGYARVVAGLVEYHASCSHLVIPFGDANAVYMQKAVCEGFAYAAPFGGFEDSRRDWDETYTGKIVHAYGTPFDLLEVRGSATPLATGGWMPYTISGLTPRENEYGPTLQYLGPTPYWAWVPGSAGHDQRWHPWAERSWNSWYWEGCYGYGARIVTSDGGASVYCHNPLAWATPETFPDSFIAPSTIDTGDDYHLTATDDFLNKRATSFLGWA